MGATGGAAVELATINALLTAKATLIRPSCHCPIRVVCNVVAASALTYAAKNVSAAANIAMKRGSQSVLEDDPAGGSGDAKTALDCATCLLNALPAAREIAPVPNLSRV